jgi:hypothetical protein
MLNPSFGSSLWRGMLVCLACCSAAATNLRAGDGVPRDPVVYMIHGEHGDQLGKQLVVVGDVDEDGVPDFAATLLDPQPGEPRPKVPMRNRSGSRPKKPCSSRVAKLVTDRPAS